MDKYKQDKLKRKFARMSNPGKVGELINGVINHVIDMVKTKEPPIEIKKLN